LVPDEKPRVADTKGMLKRAYVIAGEIWYVGEATDRRWEQGENQRPGIRRCSNAGEAGKSLRAKKSRLQFRKWALTSARARVKSIARIPYQN
jgi:hypothetical protein